MDSLRPSKIATPQSILIEQTAIKMAQIYYEAGRSTGLISKHKDARSFARANVEKFIPLAVSTLLDVLGNPAIPQSQKDVIYDAILERTNDPELSNNGIDIFKNDTPFLPDAAKIFDKPTLESAFDKGIKEFTKGLKQNGQI